MKNELNVFTNGYLPWRPCNWWFNIKYFFRSFKRAWQRATKGYSDSDLWELGFYYSNLMIASLTQFRASIIGYPSYMNSIDEWYAILDKIILLLKQANEEEPLEEKNEFAEWYEEYVKIYDGTSEPSEENWNKVKQYYKREDELYEIRQQKRKEAFDLMSEYFGHLWW